MKKLILLPLLALFVLLITPQEITAQCQGEPDRSPCFALPSGPCVAFPSGKLRVWLAARIIQQATPTMEADGLSFSTSEFLHKYYRSGELSIEYLEGSWAEGQSFRVQIGSCVIIVLTDL